ncbi:MAG: HemK2/MTQ2 family protein methyltransferase [Candidatus Woesearchaeota archaeon]
MIYEPREDSFLLEKHVRKYAKGRVLDMGTGSGILAIAAKKAEVIAADINPEAVKEVQKLGIKAIVSDLFENIGGKFDLIIFNPPYLPEDPDESEDSRLATKGGKEGHEIIERFLKDAKHFLKKDGKILMVFSSMTGDIESIMKKEGYSFKILEEKHIFFETLYAYCLTKKDSGKQKLP